MKKIFGFIRFWLRARKANKILLAQAAESKNAAPYEPPTREAVLAFVNEGRVGEFAFGKLSFRHMIGPVGNSHPKYTIF